MFKIFPFLLSLLLVNGAAYGFSQNRLSITIIAPDELLENSITTLAIKDVIDQLHKGFINTDISVNRSDADVVIKLPEVSQSLELQSGFSNDRPYHYLDYPKHDYEWRGSGAGGRNILELKTTSFQGVMFGLYGLLQEKLGFKFYHPRETLHPRHHAWPLEDSFLWSASPRFDKRGFHLHTLHPTELTEQLHNPKYPNALQEVKEYCDWLVRNQQTVWQFYLLRGIDRDRWDEHAVQIVDYAKSRGLYTGVKITLSLLQQRAFQAVKILKFFPSYEKQIDESIDWLMGIPWDFVTVDFMMGEYLPNLEKIVPELRNYLATKVTEQYTTKLLFTTHVIKKDTTDIEGINRTQSSRFGVLIHTVMCYSISEEKARVYGNENQRFMLERAKQETLRQETWYWPESAYWVSFDNSIPLFILPYLKARWDDMNTMKTIGVDNHLTFSSGWEWGYWLIDWSIARWSWEFSDTGISSPLAFLNDFFASEASREIWRRLLEVQDHFFKEKELLAYLSALDPMAEFIQPFSRPFQPQPDFTYAWLMREATDEEAEAAIGGPLADLESCASTMDSLIARLELSSDEELRVTDGQFSQLQRIHAELITALKVTSMRAHHRATTIRLLLEQRKRKWLFQPLSKAGQRYQAEAAHIRHQALQLVAKQERRYRYPVELIARRRPDFTSYHFGYLYPVSNLFFWEREEQQLNGNSFDAFYKKLWNFSRTVGLDGLLF